VERRNLGLTGISVSAIGLGTGALGALRVTANSADDRESIAAIDRALDEGINLIDTSPLDGWGLGEELVGKAVHNRRAEVLISTKCGLRISTSRTDPPQRCLAPSFILRQCDESLRRLRTDCIDLYQCQYPDPETPIGETMQALGRLIEQGKVRAVGLCNFDCEQIAAARLAGTLHFVQVAFSLVNRRAGDDLIPYCMEHRLGVLAYDCLAGGFLAAQYEANTQFTDHRLRDPQYMGSRFPRNVRFADGLKIEAQRLGKTAAQLAVNWVLSTPGVTSAVVGAKRPSQVVENHQAAGWTLDEMTRRNIDELIRGHFGAH
jgi:aryl-alcohol dehydrogenase-like predicted oxidoreductase